MPQRKYLLACSIASILTIIAGVILIVIATNFIIDIGYLYSSWTQIFSLLIFSIVNGILAILLATGFLYVITRQFPSSTKAFSYLLILVTLLSATCSIILLTDCLNLRVTSLDKTQALFNNYSDLNNTQNSKFIFQRIQQSFHCCGVNAEIDWQSKISDGISTPDSCCRNVTNDCGKNAIKTKTNIYLRGCSTSIYVYLKKVYTILISINIMTAVLALTSCITGLIFEDFIRKRYELI